MAKNRAAKNRAAKKKTFWPVKVALYKRFEEIMAEAQSRVAAVNLETQGRVNEWGLMAKKTAGVPKGMMGAVAYDPEKRRFVVQEQQAPPDESDQDDT